MGWSKEFSAQLIGTVAGGVIALGAAWVTNYGSEQKDFAAERRGKLETLISDLFREYACTLKYRSGEPVGEACDAGTAAYQSLAYAKLYFPELYKGVGEFHLAQSQLRLEMQKCLLDAPFGDKVGELRHRAKCLEQVDNSPTNKAVQIDALVEQAHASVSTITPKKWSLSTFKDMF